MVDRGDKCDLQPASGLVAPGGYTEQMTLGAELRFIYKQTSGY